MNTHIGSVARKARVLGLGLGALLSAAVWAQGSIESVSGSLQGGTEVVRIQLTEPLAAAPAGFVIQSPARIALDFPGVGNALGRSTVDINQGNMRSASVVQAGDRTRVVLNLKQATAYRTQIQGKTLLVVLEAAPTATATSSAAPPVFAESRNLDTLPLKDLDFRRGVDNTGRVVVTLPNNQVGVDIRQQGQSLVVEFLKSSLPEGLRRRLDVADFGTPIRTVTTFQSGDRVRMVIEPSGAWEHSAYQSDSQLVVEVRPQRVDSSRVTQGRTYSGEKLSLNFQNIELRSLLQVIAEFSNFNIITSDTVTGGVTLRLRDVPWDQALDIILQAKGLGMRKTGNVLWIAPSDELAAKEKQELEARAAIQNLEPLRTQAFQLNYTKAAEIAAQLTATGSGGSGTGNTGARILSVRGSVIPEPRTNQIFVSDIASRLEQVQELISKLDIPVRQVLIEARIVEATDTFGKSLGVKFGATDRAGIGIGGGNRAVFGTNYANAVAGAGGGGAINSQGTFFNFPASGLGVATPASFAVSLFGSSAARFLNLEISALEADGKGKVVSSPRVVTADQKKAIIEQGTELPYQVATSSGATSIAFRKANLKLEVTPQITPEGGIILDVKVNKDTVGQNTAAGFAINTKAIETQVLVENGGTVVIGGIFEQTDRENENRVPVLGDLPAVGVLFRNRERSVNKTELLVFLTPKTISERAAVR